MSISRDNYLGNLRETFDGLGPYFWKQVIDGRFHRYGKMVFDEGLHDGETEKGFFESLEKAHAFVQEHLGKPLSTTFYKDLHKIACAHFKGKENNTLMNAEKTGYFRGPDSPKNLCARVTLESILSLKEKQINKKLSTAMEDLFAENFKGIRPSLRIQALVDLASPRKDRHSCIDILDLIVKENFSRNYPVNLEKYNKFINELKYEFTDKYKNRLIDNFKKINNYIIKLFSGKSDSKYSDVTALMLLDYCPTAFYNCRCIEKHEKIVKDLFEKYCQSIKEINRKIGEATLSEEIEELKKKKISVIARLFQALEWLHPFEDGQGRTDLLLLAKLLTEEGWNPPILEDPYISTWSLPEEWEKVLLDGIRRWQSEREKISIDISAHGIF